MQPYIHAPVESAEANATEATVLNLDAPDAGTTVPLAMNDFDSIAGYYSDSSGNQGSVAAPARTLQPGTTIFHSHQAKARDYIFAGISQAQEDLPVMSFVHNSSNTLGTLNIGTAPISSHYYGEIRQGARSVVYVANGMQVTGGTLQIDQQAGARLILDGDSSLNDGTISANGGALVLDGTLTLGPGPATLLDLDKEKLKGHGTIVQLGEVGTIKVGQVAPGTKFEISGGVLAIDDPLSFRGRIGPLPTGSGPALGLFGVVEVYQAFDTARATFDASTGVLALLDSNGHDLGNIRFSGNISGLHLTKSSNPSLNYISINDQGTQGIGVGGNIPVSVVG